MTSTSTPRHIGDPLYELNWKAPANVALWNQVR
jgi:hypothetical protein